jgi:Flp pilus assembly protein TadG
VSRRGGRAARERGSAVVEVALVGVPLLVPLVWVAIAVSTAQQGAAAATDAARQAGRAWVTGTAGSAAGRAEDAAAAALRGRGVPTKGMRIRYAAPGAPCDGGHAGARPGAGGAVDVCVTATVRVLGRDREVTGRFPARADSYRDYR